MIARDVIGTPGYAGTVGHARADALGILATPTNNHGSSGGPEATLVIHLDRTTLDQQTSPRTSDSDHTDDDQGHPPRGEHSDDATGHPETGHPHAPSHQAAVAPPDRSSTTIPAGPTHGTLARAEGPHGLDDIGPLLLEQIRELLAHHRVRVLPVLDLASEAGVDSYEIPDRLRTQIVLRDSYSIFPYATRRARDCDLDHTTPWHPGVLDQTRPSNLGALDRRSHRAKTHAGWEVRQRAPGIFHWTSPLGYHYTVTRDGTHRHAKAPPWATTADR